MPPLISEQGLLDESYDSSEDEDFQVDDVREESDLSSSSELDDKETAAGPAKKKRRTGGKLDNQAPEADEEAFDSGDEATVRKAEEKKKRKRKGKGKGKKSTDGGDVDGEEGKDDIDDDVDVDFEDEEGGPGGFVKTRAMRSRMQEERKPLARVEGATVDVDALWEKMNDPNPEPVPLPSQTAKKDEEKEQKEKSIAAQEKGNREAVSRDKEVKPIQDEEDRRKQPQYPTEMIKIRRTYKFAGEISTEEKTVPKDSAEAKLFLANGGDAEAVTDADMEHAANVKAAMKLRRPLRRISRFDPNPTDSVKRSWEKQPVAETGADAETTKGPKINTVEKSRLDWAAYVDQAGIKDELRTHSKAKEGYLNRMDFLDRMETKKEDERRNVRLRGL